MRFNELLCTVLPMITACIGYLLGRWHQRRNHDRLYSEWMNAPLQPFGKDQHDD